MVLFQQSHNPQQEVQQLRAQGLTDSLIVQELSKKGYPPQEVRQALNQVDNTPSAPAEPSMPQLSPSYPPTPNNNNAPDSNVYERIEEITENIVDEKWDELIGEVRKIIEWKNQVEERQIKIQHDLDKIKEDFKVLHQGVLGKLEDYDDRMRDVGTELKAVGKVFKDVVPEFVDNVKELSGITQNFKKH
tara:strand:- start:238 stop:804 length:567 start_codon:yes stop_codon:yes gene_type:complete